MFQDVIANNKVERIIWERDCFAIDSLVTGVLREQIAAEVLRRIHCCKFCFDSRLRRNMEYRAAFDATQQPALRQVEPKVAVSIVAVTTRAQVMFDIGTDAIDKGNERASGGDIRVG